MPAYIIVNIEVTDPERYEDYKKLAAPTVGAHGGRYLARGGAAQRIEGSIEPKRVVVLEFPTAEAARGWWSSPEYSEARAIRESAARSDMILVEGS